MYDFLNDYNQTVHPRLLQRFLDITNQKLSGYGLDACSYQARETIQKNSNHLMLIFILCRVER